MKIFLFFLIFPTTLFLSQTSVSGNVYNENETPLSGVLVVNISTDRQTFTDASGFFSIQASVGNELRFVRKNYERFATKVSYNNSLKIRLSFRPEEIEEIVLNYKPSGNLKEDIKHYGTPKKDLKLNEDLGKYNRTISSREVLKPKIGEFIQPRGPGFDMIKKGYQWKRLDVAINLQNILGNAYFVKMGIEKSLVFSFIDFILEKFDTENIRRFGRLTSSDIARFQAEAERQIANFKSRSG